MILCSLTLYINCGQITFSVLGLLLRKGIRYAEVKVYETRANCIVSLASGSHHFIPANAVVAVTRTWPSML